MALISMTGFADRAGAAGGLGWTWEARSVNGRGLDLRLRLPEGFEALDAPIRAAAARLLARGSVTLTLRFGARRAGGAAAPQPRGAGRRRWTRRSAPRRRRRDRASTSRR